MPSATFEARADAEPHDHDREEDDLGRGPEIVEIRLVGAAEELVAAEDEPDHDALKPADGERGADLAGGDAEMPVIVRVDEQADDRLADREQRRHDVAIEQAGCRERLPADQDGRR